MPDAITRTFSVLVCASAVAVAAVGCGPSPSQPPGESAPSAPKPGDARVVTLAPGVDMELRYVAPGTFQMGKGGSYYSSGERLAVMALGFGSLPRMNEGPERTTTITRGMWVMRTKVTATQFAAFLNDIGDKGEGLGTLYADEQHVPMVFDEDASRWQVRPGCEGTPVQHLLFEGALGFAGWASRKSGLELRLPTEAEWEFIARGAENRETPFGSRDETAREYTRVFGSRLNIDSCWTSATRTYAITPEGIADLVMSGGEWTLDWYAEAYNRDDRVDPRGPAHGQFRVVRGVDSVTSRGLPPHGRGVSARLVSVHVNKD